MSVIYLQIAEHIGKVTTSEGHITRWFKKNYKIIEGDECLLNEPDFILDVESGYGEAVEDYEVDISYSEDNIIFRRTDYYMESCSDYSISTLSVYNLFALKHAMMNFYSSYIIHRGWGLLIHSSCVIEGDRAHLFSGHSGAGKSTVVILSEPRMILSDEATLIYFKDNEPYVVDSPFRSDSISNFHDQMYPLAGIYILYQSNVNKLTAIKSSDGLLHMTDKIFYWSHDANETKVVFHMLQKLMLKVPAYELYFQKNSQFWEMIS